MTFKPDVAACSEQHTPCIVAPPRQKRVANLSHQQGSHFLHVSNNPAISSGRQEDWAAVQASGSRDEKKAEGDNESPSANKTDSGRQTGRRRGDAGGSPCTWQCLFTSPCPCPVPEVHSCGHFFGETMGKQLNVRVPELDNSVLAKTATC